MKKRDGQMKELVYDLLCFRKKASTARQLVASEIAVHDRVIGKSHLGI